MIRMLAAAALAIAFSSSAIAQDAPPEAVEAAKAASTAWLASVDARKYGESPGNALWYTARIPNGTLQSRKFVSATPTRKAGSAPDGDYVAVQYESSFEVAGPAIETVTLAKEKDGSWKVASYEVRKVKDPDTITDAQIREILRQRVDVAQRGVGIVVGIVDRSGRRIIPYGTLDLESRKAVDGNSLFEIGSITKVFTGLLLADMVKKGEVGLDDPLSKFLPAGTRAPSVGGKEVTLLQLATHTSGLPRMPTNVPKGQRNPFAKYSVPQLYEFLASYKDPEAAPKDPVYSNLGFALLGHVLALRAGTSYEALLRDRIFKPLAMDSSAINLTEAQRARLAKPHESGLYLASSFDDGVMEGAGAIRSTMNDLLTFAEANLGLKPTPLMDAMRLAQAPKDTAGRQGLAWQVRSNGESVSHAGATEGYTSFMALDLKAGRAVVVLGNSINFITDIGIYLYNQSRPLQIPPPTAHFREVKLADPKAFDAYVGRYELSPDFSIVVTREGDRYFMQATNQIRFEAFPRSESEFFLKMVEVRLVFERNAAGEVTTLVLHQGGREQRGKKLPN